MNFVVLLGSNYNTDNGIEGVEQHLPRLLTRYGNVYCFEYPQFTKTFKILGKSLPLFEQIGRNLYIFRSCGLLPYGRSDSSINRFNHTLNFRIFARYIRKISSPIVTIAFTPEVIYLPQLLASSQKVFYYVVDNNYAMPFWSGRGRNQLRQHESMLFPKINGIITVSHPLLKMYRKHHQNVHLFMTPSVNLKQYDRVSKVKASPVDITRLHCPVIGFTGSVYDWKIDVPLLMTLLKAKPHYSIVFVGTFQIHNQETRKLLSKFKNFHLIGFKNFKDLPSYVASFDACIIPYITNAWGHAAYPVKVNQYLAAGKPVVTTALESLRYLHERNLIYWSKNTMQFVKNITHAVSSGMKNKKMIVARIKEGLRNDWSIRIKDFMKIIS